MTPGWSAMTDDEEWHAVIGFEGYEVSNRGRVRSLARTVPVRGRQRQKRVRERILRRDGRQQFSLSLRGTKYMRSLEQLMQQAGLGEAAL